MDREEGLLDEILALPEGLEKTVALVAWFQGIYPPGAGVPVLVGGAAAEILSGRLQLFSEQLAGRTPEPEELFSWARTIP